MDHMQQVQDLAEAWVAANANTQYTRAQVPGESKESESTETASTEPHMKPGPQQGDHTGMPSTSPPQAHQYHYDNPMDQDSSQDLAEAGASNVKSQLAAALVARGSSAMDITALTSSRKRKQSSPQPCRDVLDTAGGERMVAEEGGEPGILAKIPRPGTSSSQLDTKNSDVEHGHACLQCKLENDPEIVLQWLGKMLPVHCIVEPLDLPGRKDQARTPTEGYAIVPSTLLLKELVRVALSKLEFPMEHVHNATGVFQIRNWKPLPFNVITDNPQATVGQILGDLLSHITLKIKILPSNVKSEPVPSTPNRNNNSATTSSSPTSPNQGGLQLLGFNLKKSGFSGLDANGPTMPRGLSNAAAEIQLKLLQLLEKRGPTFLVSHGCPFSQGAVTSLMQGKYIKPIYMEKLQAFYQWYNVYNGLMDNTLVAAEKLDNITPTKPSSRHWRRPRTLFDPRHELPRLLAWYRDNPRPSRAEMEMYLAELNTMERRRNGHPLQYTSIAIWFKNARAKYRGLGRVSPGPYDGGSPPGMSGYVSDENVNMYEESESELNSKEVAEEVKPKKATLNGTTKTTLATNAAQPVILATPKQIPSITSSAFTTYTPSAKVKSAIAPLGLSNMQLAPPPRPIIKVEKDATSAGGLPVQPSPEAASHVMDISKIASGFGISLSPADTPDAMPSSVPSQVHADVVRSVAETVAAYSMIQANMANGMPDKSPLVVAHEHDIKKQQDPPPPLQPKKQIVAFKNLDLSANTSYKATRKRFNIHPAIEVPKLQAWFAVNPKPDRHSIEQYVAELNSSEFRRNQSKYDSRVVYVWFKNARAKYSRLKQGGPEGGEGDSLDQTTELDLSMHSAGSRDSSP